MFGGPLTNTPGKRKKLVRASGPGNLFKVSKPPTRGFGVANLRVARQKSVAKGYISPQALRRPTVAWPTKKVEVRMCVGTIYSLLSGELPGFRPPAPFSGGSPFTQCGSRSGVSETGASLLVLSQVKPSRSTCSHYQLGVHSSLCAVYLGLCDQIQVRFVEGSLEHQNLATAIPLHFFLQIQPSPKQDPFARNQWQQMVCATLRCDFSRPDRIVTSLFSGGASKDGAPFKSVVLSSFPSKETPSKHGSTSLKRAPLFPQHHAPQPPSPLPPPKPHPPTPPPTPPPRLPESRRLAAALRRPQVTASGPAETFLPRCDRCPEQGSSS